MNTTNACRRHAGKALFLTWLLAVGTTPARAEQAGTAPAGMPAMVTGAQIYTHLCQGCHMAQGQGATGAGSYPALAGDPAPFMAVILLHGRRNMPAFASKDHGWEYFHVLPSLTYAQIAAVINHVRTHFGNHYKDVITAAEVKALDH